MQNQLQRKTNFSIFYILLAIADFGFTIYNNFIGVLNNDYGFPQVCVSILRKALYLLPLIGFIFISKKVSEIDDLQKRLKIKKYVIIYLVVDFVFGIINYLVEFPIFPSCLFFSSSWLFCLIYLIRYQFLNLVFTLVLDICFWIISILFVKNITKKADSEEVFKIETGATSTGYKLGIASIVILSIQTVLNVLTAAIMHENLSDTAGEHAIGTAFFALILIAVKVFLDLIVLPAIPLSIAGLVKCNSKKEIEQNRKHRLLGRKINIVCLVIAVIELVVLW